MQRSTLPKTERVSGKTAVARLFGHGKGGVSGCIRYRYVPSEEADSPSRILVSVPKRLFKRAVKRNLLKRRIRESYRRQKGLLGPGKDLLLQYNSPELLPFDVIYADITGLLTAISEGR